MENLKVWARSSMDPTQVSNTIKGAATTFSGVILIALAIFAHPVDPSSLQAVIDQVAGLGGQVAAGLGAAWTLYGLVMKFVVWIGTKPAVQE